ncbi:MAG: helicase, partial [Verrucomicrobiales bacterium]
MASVRARKTEASGRRTLADHLSHLNLRQAESLLGADGKTLIMEGGKLQVESPEEVILSPDEFVLNHKLTGAEVMIRLSDAKRGRIEVNCSECAGEPCVHKGTALSFILEEKMLLGLAAPPPERVPVEALPEDELVAQAIAEREERARVEKMRVKALDATTPWTDYTVMSKSSGKTYRVALRGWEPGQLYCSCPDFRKNTLGLCKHTLQVCRKVRRKFSSRVCATPWKPDRFAVSLSYGRDLSVRLEGPDRGRRKAAAVARKLLGTELRSPREFRGLLKAVRELERLGEEVTIYPDAEEFLTRRLDREGVVRRMAAIRKDPATHPLRESLLKNAPLLPYRDNTVNLLVAETRGAVPAEEMTRVLVPLGVAYVKHGDTWTKTVKPPREGTDEWTHYLHDASGNPVAHDTVVGPPRHL